MLVFTTISAALAAGFIAFSAVNVQSQISEAILQPLNSQGDLEAIKEEHSRLAFKGNDPYRVLTLASTLHPISSSGSTSRHMALLSDFYGQSYHLAKRRKFISAIIFFRHALWHSSQVDPMADVNNEVRTAPQFALATRLPLIGRMWKKDATLGLKAHLSQLNSMQDPALRRVSRALCLAKLVHLGDQETSATHVFGTGIRKSDDTTPDHGQLQRIARHLSMNFDEFMSKIPE